MKRASLPLQRGNSSRCSQARHWRGRPLVPLCRGSLRRLGYENAAVTWNMPHHPMKSSPSIVVLINAAVVWTTVAQAQTATERYNLLKRAATRAFAFLRVEVGGVVFLLQVLWASRRGG